MKKNYSKTSWDFSSFKTEDENSDFKGFNDFEKKGDEISIKLNSIDYSSDESSEASLVLIERKNQQKPKEIKKQIEKKEYKNIEWIDQLFTIKKPIKNQWSEIDLKKEVKKIQSCKSIKKEKILKKTFTLRNFSVRNLKNR